MEKRGGWFGRWLDWSGKSADGFFFRRVKLVASPEFLATILVGLALGQPMFLLEKAVANHFAPLPKADVPQAVRAQDMGALSNLTEIYRQREIIGTVMLFFYVAVVIALVWFVFSIIRNRLGRRSFIGGEYPHERAKRKKEGGK